MFLKNQKRKIYVTINSMEKNYLKWLKCNFKKGSAYDKIFGNI